MKVRGRTENSRKHRDSQSENRKIEKKRGRQQKSLLESLSRERTKCRKCIGAFTAQEKIKAGNTKREGEETVRGARKIWGPPMDLKESQACA